MNPFFVIDNKKTEDNNSSNKKESPAFFNNVKIPDKKGSEITSLQVNNKVVEEKLKEKKTIPVWICP